MRELSDLSHPRSEVPSLSLARRERVKSEAPFMRVTEAAMHRIQTLLTERNAPSVGVRIMLRTRGCAALSYAMEYVDEVWPEDQCLTLSSGLQVFVQSRAMIFLVGTEMDYAETPTQSGFVFRNPNEKGRCGCGTSFHV